MSYTPIAKGADTTWADYHPSEKKIKRYGDNICFTYQHYDGTVTYVKKKEVQSYFDETFFSAYKIYLKIKNLGPRS